MARVCVAGLLTLGLLACAVAPAAAHAALTGSNPADGATLGEVPPLIELTFSEAVSRQDVALTGPDGSDVAVTDIGAVDNVVTARVGGPGKDASTGSGEYRIGYRVLSADGHVVQGEVRFTVRVAGDAADGGTESGSAAEQEESFVDEHMAHMAWGAAAITVAVLLIAAPLLPRIDRRQMDAER